MDGRRNGEETPGKGEGKLIKSTLDLIDLYDVSSSYPSTGKSNW